MMPSFLEVMIYPGWYNSKGHGGTVFPTGVKNSLHCAIRLWIGSAAEREPKANLSGLSGSWDVMMHYKIKDSMNENMRRDV